MNSATFTKLGFDGLSLRILISIGISLVIQELRLLASNTGGLGLIPDWGTRSNILQIKILYAETKTEDPMCLNQDSAQPNKQTKKYFKSSNGKFNLK